MLMQMVKKYNKGMSKVPLFLFTQKIYIDIIKLIIGSIFMKKKIIIISSIIVVLITLLISILLINNKREKNKEEMINDIKSNIKELIKYTNKNNLSTSGVINVTAKYKGAHGEHYPKEFIYNFNTLIDGENYIVTIGNELGYVEKTYQMPGLILMNKIKNINPDQVDDIFKSEINVSDINKYLDTNYKKCTYELKANKIICDKDYLFIDDNTINIKFKNNLFKIDTSEKMFSVIVNEKLKMNAFYYDDSTRYNVVLNNNVIYFETSNNKLYLNSTSQAAIYNALELTVDYKDVAVTKDNKIDEIEIPIFRYFNELDLNYWSGANE